MIRPNLIDPKRLAEIKAQRNAALAVSASIGDKMRELHRQRGCVEADMRRVDSDASANLVHRDRAEIAAMKKKLIDQREQIDGKLAELSLQSEEASGRARSLCRLYASCANTLGVDENARD